MSTAAVPLNTKDTLPSSLPKGNRTQRCAAKCCCRVVQQRTCRQLEAVQHVALGPMPQRAAAILAGCGQHLHCTHAVCSTAKGAAQGCQHLQGTHALGNMCRAEQGLCKSVPLQAAATQWCSQLVSKSSRRGPRLQQASADSSFRSCMQCPAPALVATCRGRQRAAQCTFAQCGMGRQAPGDGCVTLHQAHSSPHLYGRH